MTMPSRRAVLAALLPAWVFAAAEGGLGAEEKARIEALLKRVSELKDAEFVRNGKAYAPADAVKFFRGKLDKMGSGVSTAEQFVEKIASVSSTTGKPYLIRHRDGREEKCGEVLAAWLREIR